MDASLFHSKVFLVTGAARGIGQAIAQQLLRYGAYVYALDILENPDFDSSSRGTYIQADVRDRAKSREVVDTIVAKHGRLDGLVNNAAICPLEGETPPDEVFEDVYDINVRGTWNMGTAALTQMVLQGGGSIVNIGSTSSTYGVARLPCYVSSKHAVLGLTRTWALDFAKHDIRVNCVGPGATDTPMARSPLQMVMGPKFGGNKTDDELLDLVAQSIPLGRIGTPDDVANAVNFLLSDLASFITGQILLVSGGQ